MPSKKRFWSLNAFCVNITPLHNPMMVNWSIVHGKALQRSHDLGPGQFYISNRTFSSFFGQKSVLFSTTMRNHYCREAQLTANEASSPFPSVLQCNRFYSCANSQLIYVCSREKKEFNICMRKVIKNKWGLLAISGNWADMLWKLYHPEGERRLTGKETLLLVKKWYWLKILLLAPSSAT